MTIRYFHNRFMSELTKIVLFFVAGYTFSSCEETIDLDKYKGEPTLVLNVVANTDTTIMADISTTWFFTDTQKPSSYSDLKVELLINDQSKGLMPYSNGFYRSDARPNAGDKVTIRTVVDGKELTASDTIPQGVVIDQIEIKKEKVPGPESVQVTPYEIIRYDYELAYTYNISFTDKVPGNHYYLVYISSANNMPMGNVDYSKDPHFMLTAQEINQSLSSLKTISTYGFPFTNIGDSTQHHTIMMEERGAPFYYNQPEGCERVITIFSITESYYKYVIGLMANSDITWHGNMTEKGLVQPVKIFSNIQGGTGIFACCTPTRTKVSLQ